MFFLIFFIRFEIQKLSKIISEKRMLLTTRQRTPVAYSYTKTDTPFTVFYENRILQFMYLLSPFPPSNTSTIIKGFSFLPEMVVATQSVVSALCFFLQLCGLLFNESLSELR